MFKASGRSVPVFIDKHLSYNRVEASEMVEQARGLNVPLMAGSSLPVTWRLPPLEIPLGRQFKEASWRRAAIWRFRLPRPRDPSVHGRAARPPWQGPGGRRGHVPGRRRGLGRRRQGVWSWSLLDHALGRSHTVNPGDIRQNTRDFMPPPAPGRDALTKLGHPVAFVVEYADGLRATVLILNGHVDDTTFAARLDAATGGDTIVSTLTYLPAPPGASFFNPLVLRIEDFFRTGRPPYPVERTLLTGGILDVALESRIRDHKRIATPDLAAIDYPCTGRFGVYPHAAHQPGAESAVNGLFMRRILQRNIPVSVAQEARPACDAGTAGVVQGFPGRANRGAAKLHAGLIGSAVGLARVARHARQSTVFPGGLPSLRARDHVIDREFLGAGLASAILAGGMISFEEVAAAERHGLMSCPIVARQCQNFRDPEVEPAPSG